MTDPSLLISAFEDWFRAGKGFDTIVQARRFASAFLGQPVLPGTAQAKIVDESIEQALIRVAQLLIQPDSEQTYDRLVELYQRQPTLGTRSSTSVLQQAYSTPLPIASLAATLVGINSQTTVYEPSAGNGALLLHTNPANVTANELNPARANDLRRQGYTVTQENAANYLPSQLHDVVIMNPPFGSLSDERGVQRFHTGQYLTTQIDHAIALNALKAMKPDGKAVLILGGKLGMDEDRRSDRYNSRESRAFYYTLYNAYNVTEHISIWGDLYRKQGAGFPIDLILISGRGKAERLLPAADVPRIYKSFTELKELLYAAVLRQPERLESIARPIPNSSLGSDSSPDKPDSNRELGGILGTVGEPSGMDDSAGSGSESSLPNDSPLSERGTPGSSDLESARPGGRPPTVGRGDHDLQSRTPTADVDEGDLGLSTIGDRQPRHHPTHSRHPTRSLAATHDVLAIPEDISEETVMSDQDQDIQRQVAYTPHSQGTPAGTLVPVNMKTATHNALNSLARQVGSLDEYVAEKLAYGTPADLHKYLTAEQIDAVALAISNIEKGSGFIIGDQTGVGKGRVVASLIRYAKLSGQTPIFITKKPDLYADMMRDLADVDLGNFKPFMTNESLRIPLPEGGQLRTGASTHQQEMRSLLQSGNLGSYDGIFTTYYQLQAVGGEEPERRDFLRRFANNAILLLDESHMAGGSISDRGDSKVSNRADFTRELIERSQGVLYSSATYAKNPQVMTLYSKTNMRLAVGHMETLVSLIQKMGVPGQQALATMLTEEGQYIRRERSYEGIRFTAEATGVDREVAENAAAIMSSIMDFDRVKQAAVKAMNKELKREAKAFKRDTAIGEAGAKSIEFASLMHNLIDQMLLSLKAEATVQKSLELLRNGEKPVITVANTMGSFIGNYAAAHGIKPGDALDLDFGAMLSRYLERSREVIIKDAYGIRQYNHTRMDGSSCYRLSDEELGLDGVAAFEDAIGRIQETDFSALPISPIDYIENRLQQSGYQVSEVTGREHQIEYLPDGGQFYQARSQADRSTRAAIENVKAFNQGRFDVMVLNQAGSTGISLHASEKFLDQRPRHMVVAQAERNIDDFMQMLGRIHRHGQVALPSYTLLCADIPAEKRPGAVLAKKMALLNANTTAARSSSISLNNVPDFMNEYGDAVVSEIMINNPELHARLGSPLKFLDDGDEPEAAIRKVTGRIPLLPIADQESLYDLIEREYVEYVERQEAMGESILEAQSLDFDARTIARMEVVAADAGITSQFTSPVYLDVVDVKTLRKPLTTQEAVNFVRRYLDQPEVGESFNLYEIRPQIKQAATDLATEQIQALRRSTEDYRAKFQIRVPPKQGEAESETQLRTSKAIDKFNTRLDQQLNHVRQTLDSFPAGTPVRIATANESVFYGVTARVWNTDVKGNPTAPGNWKIQFLLADPAKELTIPLSKVNLSASNAISVVPKEYDFFDEPIYEVFDQRQRKNREERQIFTGNTLRAIEKFHGKMINYTNTQGITCQGVLTPPGFDIEKALEREPVQMTAPQDVIRFLFEVTQRSGQLKTPDELLIVRAQRRRDGNGILLQTPKAKEEGGQYFLDKQLMEAAGGGEFFSVGKKMILIVPPERIESVIQFLNARDLSLSAFEQRQKARDMLGIELPSLQLIEQNQFEAKADYVPFVQPVNTQVISSLEQAFQADIPSSFVEEAESNSEVTIGQASYEVEPTLEAISEAEIPISEESAPIELISPDNSLPASTTSPASQAFWASRFETLSDELKRLLQPAQIIEILTQPDPRSTIAQLQDSQPIFATVYQELADLYTTATMNLPQAIPAPSQQLLQSPLTELQTQLITELEQIPNAWALTPVDAHKASYRTSWQTESPLSRDELTNEIRNGASGYGLRTGSVSGGIVAIDLDGVSAHAKMLELSGGTDLPETVSFTSGRVGRAQHLFLVPQELWSLIKSRKIPTGMKGKDGKKEHVELRWQGLQSVLPPSAHPTTGQYRWLRSPQETEITTVPNWVIDRMLVETKPVSVEQIPSFAHPPIQVNWTDRDWALSYLTALQPHRAEDRESWLKVGMALHSVSPNLFLEWDRWSTQSQKYRPGECEYVWNRFQENGGITIATLGAWAKADGWRFPIESQPQVELISEITSSVQPYQQSTHQHNPQPTEWVAQSDAHHPCLQEFKRWYFEAREIGRSQKYLDRIQALAEDFKAKTSAATTDPTIRNSDVSLSAAALTHLTQDAESYHTKLEQFAKDAKTILKYKGTAVLVDGKTTYQYSSRKPDYQLFYHGTQKRIMVKKAGQTLLDHQGGKIQPAQKAIGAEDFECFYKEANRLREQAKQPPTSLKLARSSEQER